MANVPLPFNALFIAATLSKNERTRFPQYIAASYVKWIELAGGRVVPIPYNGTTDEMDTIFSRINGLLLPGGGAEVSAGATYIVKKAIQAVRTLWCGKE